MQFSARNPLCAQGQDGERAKLKPWNPSVRGLKLNEL
jgi:hypothetical protein